MTLRLWLVRHAQSTWNAAGRMQGWADPPLSDVGREQAALAAARFASEPLTAIYTSPQIRAVETAQAIGAVSGCEPILDPRLREIGVGQAEGCSWDDWAARWPQVATAIARSEFALEHVPDSEPLPDFLARVEAVFADIHVQHVEGNIAVVAHGGVFRAYFGQLLKTAQRYCATLTFGNASLSLVTFAPDSWASVRFINDTSHLQNGAGEVLRDA